MSSRSRDTLWSLGIAFVILAQLVLVGVGFFVVGFFLFGFADPPEAPEPVNQIVEGDLIAFQTTDNLVVVARIPGDSHAAAETRIDVLDPNGRIVRTAHRTVEPSKTTSYHHFDFAAPSGPPEGLTLRCSFRGHTVETPLTSTLLAKAHETSLSVSKTLFAGSSAVMTCSVRGVRSIHETVPLPGSSVVVRLRDDEGKAHELHSGKVGDDGSATLSLRTPDIAAGDYTLEVETKSRLGSEVLKERVRVENSPRILLTTDKPMYQPGQVIHFRALSLHSYTLDPIEGQDITFEIEDGKGNKVSKQSQRTSEYGLASADFHLADEVNEGVYRIRARIGRHQTVKMVTVAPYVLPRFETKLTTDKKFYLPSETITGDLQADYFFGKPVGGANVVVKATAIARAPREFFTWNGKTDEQGHSTFEIPLPTASATKSPTPESTVRLEVEVTDTADHTKKKTTIVPVSSEAVLVHLIPEGGRLIPEMDNRIFVSSTYPDGSPASVDVRVWLGKTKSANPVVSLKTNASGLAEFRLSPARENLERGEHDSLEIEYVDGSTSSHWTEAILLPLCVEATDAKGNRAESVETLSTEPVGANIRLRVDKALADPGKPLAVEVHCSSDVPTVRLDIIRRGQTILTRQLDLVEGSATSKLKLPANVVGAIEVHASQPLPSGEVIRDSRVIYVRPTSSLNVEATASQEVFRPGEEGTITFRVTDPTGKATPAALGVIIVDEAVYALQELRPGLERVYFTLQEELAKPTGFEKRPDLDELIHEETLPAEKQQIAEVLLTTVRPKVPERWVHRPDVDRLQNWKGAVSRLRDDLIDYAFEHEFLVRDGDSWSWRPNLLERVRRSTNSPELALDSLGRGLTIEDLAQRDPSITPAKIAVIVTRVRLLEIHERLHEHLAKHGPKGLRIWGRWMLPEDILETIALEDQPWTRDAWGRKYRLVCRNRPAFFEARNEVISAGPDGVVGTIDDISRAQPKHTNPETRLVHSRRIGDVLIGYWAPDRDKERRAAFNLTLDGYDFRRTPIDFAMLGGISGEFPEFPELPVQNADIVTDAPPIIRYISRGHPKVDLSKLELPSFPALPADATNTPPTRLRQYFPETMLWRPALITDENGVAELPVRFADSITTWRLSASASSKAGLLGSTSKPLRVFQDFFVEIDAATKLTQNDEVEFPLAVFNYLKQPQTVRIELQSSPWFDLVGDDYDRRLEIGPNEVTSVKFRIRAKKIGHFPLGVKATGSTLSDAVQRVVEVVPDGKKSERVASDRLTKSVSETLVIPDDAIAGGSRLFVKVYPGVMSQVIDGLSGMLRIPDG